MIRPGNVDCQGSQPRQEASLFDLLLETFASLRNGRLLAFFSVSNNLGEVVPCKVLHLLAKGFYSALRKRGKLKYFFVIGFFIIVTLCCILYIYICSRNTGDIQFFFLFFFFLME